MFLLLPGVRSQAMTKVLPDISENGPTQQRHSFISLATKNWVHCDRKQIFTLYTSQIVSYNKHCFSLRDLKKFP